MNLSVRLAGLFGTAAFLVTAMPGFYKQIQPHDFAQMATDTISGMSMLETLGLSLGGAIAAGLIGYMIGDILSHPAPKPKKKVIVKKQTKEFVPSSSHSSLPEDSPLYEAPPTVPDSIAPQTEAPDTSPLPPAPAP